MSRYRLIGGPLDGAEIVAEDDVATRVLSNVWGRWYVECWYWPLPNGTGTFMRFAYTEQRHASDPFVARDLMPIDLG